LAHRTETTSAANEIRSTQVVRQKESFHALHPNAVSCPARLHRRRSADRRPWIFQFSEHDAATTLPIVLGIGLIAYSLFTNYELGVWKVAPMAVHNLIDIAAGARLAASPWIFGFADESANVWVPHLVGPRRDLPRSHDEAAGRVQLPQEHRRRADHRRRLVD